jgi:predicted metal-dependent phosphoesterase TrpH
MKFVDFHIHTSASDGSFSPAEVVALAAKANLSAIGITDHDTMEGVPDARLAGKQLNMEIIPGIEFSAHFKDAEIHILGYYCRSDNIPLQRTIGRLKDDRYERMRKMVYKLNKLGIRVSFAEVLAEVQGNAIGRPHLARVLCEKGYCQTLGEAFRRYIGFNSPAFVKRKEFTPAEAIEVIRGAGGVPVLAHPGTYGKVDFFPCLLREGLEGVEVFHPRNTMQISYKYLKLAFTYGLLITGGSDYHGGKEGQGPQLGDVKLDLSFLGRLKQRSKVLRELKRRI